MSSASGISAKQDGKDGERQKLLQEQSGKPLRMQGYGGTVAVPTAPSAPPDFSSQGYPPGPGGQGYPPTSSDKSYPPGGQGYPPAGQGYPPGGNSGGQGYPPIPSDKSYPPGGQGYPPGGQGYPPAGQGYPPAGQGYPPGGNSGGQGYPPTPSDKSYPPGGQGYPPGGQGYPPAGQGYPPGGQGYPTAEDNGAPFKPPPPGFLDPVPGYDSITFDDVPIMPPSYEDAIRPSAPEDRKPLNGLPVLSEQQARSALLEHCSAHCCYGSGAAREMTIRDMSSSSAFHYTLETFTESRKTAWAQVPFTGREAIDSAMNGQPPLPWDIQLYAKEKFKTEIKKLEVPHTACVKPCHSCQGCGYFRCTSCHGRGSAHCMSCSGSGRQMSGADHRHCMMCGGTGHRSCISCSGTGRRRCNVCQGCGQLKWFIQLTVTWTNHFEDYILERTAMPDELIRKAQGHIAFQEEQPWLYPVNHCPEVTVNKASNDLIEKHRKAFPNERQLLQRQAIRIVPVTEVHSQWKAGTFTFYVYGFENRVYSADYPQQCCCGCTIL